MTLTEYLDSLREALQLIDVSQVQHAANVLRHAQADILIVGNGGSAATASHLANDLAKRAGLRVVPLMDSAPLLTAWANDNGYEDALARMLEPWRDTGVLVVITTSGESRNLACALEYARREDMPRIVLCGNPDSLCAQLANILIVTPGATQQMQEDTAAVICHLLTEMLAGPLQNEDHS